MSRVRDNNNNDFFFLLFDCWAFNPFRHEYDLLRLYIERLIYTYSIYIRPFLTLIAFFSFFLF